MVVTAIPHMLSSAIPSIRWPLGTSSCPPLHYECLESLKALRKTPQLDLVKDLPSAVEALFPRTDDTEKRHFGLLATALILIGNGYTDECHNLITPLSWPDDIHFAYEPSVYHNVSPEARAYATYVHCLVHRREAFNVGEFGMLGFANANFWSRAVATSSGVHLLPHEQIASEVRALAKHNRQPCVSSSSSSIGFSMHELLAWTKEHASNDLFFESRAVHELCANALRDTTNMALREFAEQVAETEVRVLLAHALQKAGFDVSVDYILHRFGASSLVLPSSNSEYLASYSIDESIALTAARKVSSAHLERFHTSGSIVLRQVVQGDDALSSAAGVACRLLVSPACRLVTHEHDRRHPFSATQRRLLHIALPLRGDQAQQLKRSFGVSLSPGDLFATISTEEPQLGREYQLIFAPCDASEPACFVDRLYDTRGDTPTTVVQWSKGTIF